MTKSTRVALVGVFLVAGFVSLSAVEAAPALEAKPPQPAPKSAAEMQALRDAALAKQKKWEDELKFELVGIGRVAGVPVALVSANRYLCAVMTNGPLADRTVSEIDVERQQLTLLRRRDKSSEVLTLTTDNPITIPDISPGRVEVLLSKERIKRDREFPGPPRGMFMFWNELAREKQAQLLLHYLHQGLVIGAIGSEGYSSRLLEPQITQRIKEKREAFLASLTPEQRAPYAAPQALIRFADPPSDRQRQASAAKTVQAKRDEVVAGLTPEQKALYDEYQSWIRP